MTDIRLANILKLGLTNQETIATPLKNPAVETWGNSAISVTVAESKFVKVKLNPDSVSFWFDEFWPFVLLLFKLLSKLFELLPRLF